MGSACRRDLGRTFVLFLIALAGLAPALTAQEPYRRPQLDRDADTLDARSYWSYSNLDRVSWDRTRDARYWAWRLEPDDTNYLFGVYLALWYRQPQRWRQEFQAGAEYVTRSREAKQIDSLWPEILLRNPYPHLQGPCVWPRGIEDYMGDRDPVFAAVVLYDNNCHEQAAEQYQIAIQKHPDMLWLRMDRARSLAFRRQYHAAIREINHLLDSLRARDEQYLSRVYQSKAFFEYMVGVAAARTGDTAVARAAFGRALTEDLTFWPAHARLGDVAEREGHFSEAQQEYELAVGLKGDDPVLRFRYGVVLMRDNQFADAETQFREAMRLDPWWMEPYGQLAVALDHEDKTAEAVTMYREYAARIPDRLSSWRDRALARAQELENEGS